MADDIIRLTDANGRGRSFRGTLLGPEKVITRHHSMRCGTALLLKTLPLFVVVLKSPRNKPDFAPAYLRYAEQRLNPHINIVEWRVFVYSCEVRLYSKIGGYVSANAQFF